MKILILVLSSYDPPYRKLYETSLKTWDSYKVDGIDVVYYFGRNGIKKPNTIVTNYQETYLNIGKKTRQAFQIALQKYEFDYLFRPNSSSFVYKDNMKKHFETLPKSVFQGLIAPYYDMGKFMWGVGYTLSRDIVELLANIEWDMSLMDDVSVSFAAQKAGVQLTGGHKLLTIDPAKDNGYRLLNYGVTAENKIIKDISEVDMSEHFHFRCKQDKDRNKDIKIMEQLYGNIKRNLQ
jgi:hypothetical protein